MTSLMGSLMTLRGEPNLEGPKPEPRLLSRGDPDELLGERGGTEPNIEDGEPAFGLLLLKVSFAGRPVFAFSAIVFT
jgi:hypothetical protein